MPRILLIEDEPNVADNLMYALETEGFDAVHHTTGTEGLAAARADGFDLVILDVGLPDTDGFSVCRELRKHSAVPVIFLTARAGEIDRVVGLEIGGDDYVTKPFSPREVTARVKAVLRRVRPSPAPPTPEPTTAGPTELDIDEDRFEMLWHGVRLDLTRYEFRLLACLARQPGRVFTREQLMDQGWEDPGASTERTIDTHIKRLRAKLREVAPDEAPIQTVRGIGYTFRTTP